MSRPKPTRARRDPVRTFAALGDRTRLLLVVTLSDGRPRSIVGLSADFRLSRQAVTKHLRVLQRAGIVKSRRVGRENRFAYAPEPIADARFCLAEVAAQWDDALARLKSFVER